MIEPAAATTDRTPPPRVPMWDTARFLCVALVVIGHAIQRLIHDSDLALGGYLFIYAWHMPAFALISGYFSKAGPPTELRMRRMITDILLPYAIMESLWTTVKFVVEGRRVFDPTTPSWTLWFLLALAIFRLILPYLALIRWPLLLAIAASVGIGYLDNVDKTFSLSRAIGILPFFVLGWRMREWDLVRRWFSGLIPRWPVRIAAVALFAAWAVIVWIGIDLWRETDLRYWFFYDRAYDRLGDAEWWFGLVRLGVLMLGAVLAIAFLTLVTNRQLWITPFGRSTMYIYLLHSFALYPLRESGILEGTAAPNLLLVIMIAVGAALSVLLGTSPVRRFFQPLIEPRAEWLFRESESESRRTSRPGPTGSG
ncbi:acyltransferase family protein [Ruicaihuangia caeni]|uniref:acyltransferase family protein n=1 Tax=Ruicaihuangia caeni TaxID=3042517 RepID=UPI00338F4867